MPHMFMTLQKPKPTRKGNWTPIRHLYDSKDEIQLACCATTHLLRPLLIAADSCSSKQKEADQGQVDHTLEEQEEVGVVGRGARELELQHI